MKKQSILFLKGILLGISMVLPGISGGTVAFILGIYEKLIHEIAKINFRQATFLPGLFTLKKEKILQSFFLLIRPYDWFFIVPLFLGSVFAVIFFVLLAPPIIEKHFVEFYSLIFGLIVMSLYSPFKKMQKNRKTLWLLLLSFIVNFSGFYLLKESSITPREMTPFLFLPTGFLVAATLIIPGLSGSYLLILLGLYQATLEALRDFNLFFILFFLIGLILGLIFMVRFIKIGLKKYNNESLAIILGLILGSLYGLWSFLKKSFENQLHFETDIQLFLFYISLPFLIWIIYSVLSRFIKKKLLS